MKLKRWCTVPRAEYILFKRRLPDGSRSTYWYVEFWDESQQRYVNRRSTKQKRKDRAAEQAIEWLTTGAPDRSRGSWTVQEYVSSFWRDDSDYVSMRRIRKGGKGISQAYVDNMRRSIESHFVPWLKQEKIDSLLLARFRAHHLEKYQLHLHRIAGDHSKAPGRWINSQRQAVTVALNRAAKLGLIEVSPAAAIEKAEEEPASRSILSLEDAARFLADTWTDQLHRTLNLVAAYSGLRLGELRGLLPEHLEVQTIGSALVPVIKVRSNWVERDERKHPKMGSARDVPIPQFVYDALRDLIAANPWRDNGPIFYSTRRGVPVSKTAVGDAFRDRKAALKIKDDLLVFHSWRHWYNTYMRTKLDDHVLKQLTRHKTEQLTDRYTHMTAEQMVAVVSAAGSLRSAST